MFFFSHRGNRYCIQYGMGSFGNEAVVEHVFSEGIIRDLSRDSFAINTLRQFLRRGCGSYGADRLTTVGVMDEIARMFRERRAYLVMETHPQKVLDDPRRNQSNTKGHWEWHDSQKVFMIDEKMPSLSAQGIIDFNLRLYRWWQKHLVQLGVGQYARPGIVSNIRKYVIGQDNLPDCIDYSQACADFLNSNGLYPGTWAVPVPSDKTNVWHYLVVIKYSGGELDRYDPWKSNFFH
ncbi:hypothetical protein [Holophaga foetida]|uniref:hypothetical protein n=1 Tax=Holophaga foetida TaxID=35839 RepID=UPI0002473F61|nr:hypothetical protein [Holophaga foetida]